MALPLWRPRDLYLLLSPLRLAVDEELRLLPRGVYHHRGGLTNALGPGPVREDVRHGQVRTPVRLVEVETILREPCQVDDAGVRASCASSRVGIGFAQVVEALQNVGRNANRIVEAAEKTAEASTKGQKAVSAIDRIVLEIRDDSREISDRSADLLSSVDEIATIIGSVKGIADQSKILAVNASVEAAKAGPYGVGFAVVAQEIKSLAQQSKTAALQINATLGSVRQAIENVVSTANRGRQRAEQGVTLVANTGAAMNDLGAAIRENSGSAIAIASSIEQQTIELNQIASAIEQINVLVMETEPTSGGLEQSLEEMNERVKMLLETVDQARCRNDTVR